jgi:cell division septation protein DedD/nucleoid DNA-binding protein
MRPFDHHIYSLLLDHDCVIVPSLGGFIASRENARIDTGKQLGLPPRRTIAFNVFLKQNDGLLAHRLVETEKVSYPEAVQSIEAYVNDCLTEMEKGQRINIRQVGLLSRDDAGNLQFDPDTKSMLLPEAFGLSPITAHAMEADVATTSKLRKLRPSIRPKRVSNGQKRERSLVGALAIAGAIVWFSFNVYLVSRDRYTKASLNPLDSVLPVANNNVPTVAPTITPTITLPDTAATASIVPAVQDTTHRAAPDTTSVATVSPVSVEPMAGNYFVVAGVFKMRENADRLIAGLRAEGYLEATIIDTNQQTYYVSYGQYKTHAAALAMHNQLQEVSKDTWVYHRH